MRVHQKQLPSRCERNADDYFLAVLDNEGGPDGTPSYGNSFVTNARFADARFLRDRSQATAGDRMDQLAICSSRRSWAMYADKTQRIQGCSASPVPSVESHEVMLAAHLCKADLVTEMVKESTCQGKWRIYAREEGQPESVWQAIYDHYLPLTGRRPARTSRGRSSRWRTDRYAGRFSHRRKTTARRIRSRYAARPRASYRSAQPRPRQLAIGVETLIDSPSRCTLRRGWRYVFNGTVIITVNRQLKEELLAFFADAFVQCWRGVATTSRTTRSPRRWMQGGLRR